MHYVELVIFVAELREPETIDELGDEEVVPFRYSITSFGADYPVDGLVKRIADGSVYLASGRISLVTLGS